MQRQVQSISVNAGIQQKHKLVVPERDSVIRVRGKASAAGQRGFSARKLLFSGKLAEHVYSHGWPYRFVQGEIYDGVNRVSKTE